MFADAVEAATLAYAGANIQGVQMSLL